MPTRTDRPPSGLPYAIGVYLLWGLFPFYFRLVRHVPALEMVGWRILFTIPVCIAIVAWRGQFAPVRLALRDRRVPGALAASSLLIGSNWLVYVFAIQSGHVFATSLGYYINPLVNVLAGTLFLRERLTRPQWLAVALATVGVVILAWGAREMLWISLMLAFSFAGYGLVRKLAPVEALPGLTIESLILALPAAGIVLWYAASPAGSSLGVTPGTDFLLAISGLVTAIPLLLFAVAARRMEYSTLGFIQFLTPTILFLLGLTVFGEPLRPVQLACFGFIWSAIAVFSFDLLARRRGRGTGAGRRRKGHDAGPDRARPT
ncbi:EamA family transporter RarD [Novosphingobium album (ex Liu et al. 2023)]|uniref:EamA family transporter RarD n=1 Tax=Novosphingobium album (ex Liu et al. 2023) TaxID=3031130 RepID=A0ABT5WSE3_9SPHN|nr:EamA family transporter RarD [Novosphingobium album (ex Liu et al. 2023)]MDE8652952.1 EamA family transporter RarD [Novosphingobium album (ex Liu et al. 2023)]